MSRQKADPVETAFRAVIALDTDQQRALRVMADAWLRATIKGSEAPTPRRKRATKAEEPAV